MAQIARFNQRVASLVRSFVPRRAPMTRSGSALAIGLAFALILSCSKGRPLVPEGGTAIERQPSQSEAPVHFEHESLRIDIKDDGTYEEVYRLRYRIVNQQGVEGWSYSSAAWSPWYTDKPTIETRVINRGADGQEQVTRLDPDTIAVEPAHPQAPDMYGDSLVMRAPLPNVRVGTIIDETVTTRTHKVFLSPAHLHSLAFAEDLPKDEVKLTITAPEDVELRFEIRDADVERSERVENGRRILEFRGGPYAALEEPEPGLPYDVAYWPYVAVTPGQSWSDLAGTYTDIVEQALKGIDFSSTVGELVERRDSERERAEKLLAWLKQRVRYVGIEFGESAVVPHAPDKTIASGFGDCKDQATLLVGLLRAAGLDAHVALLRSGYGENVIEELPALNVFNHAIVFVDGKEPLWIDPTADLMKVGVLPTADQGRFALVARKSEKALRKIPFAAPEDNRYFEERQVLMRPEKKADIIEISRGEGYFDWSLRDQMDAPNDAREEALTNYVKSVYAAEKLGEFDAGEPANLLEPFHIELQAEEAEIAETLLLDGSATLSEGALFRWIPDALFPSDEERKTALLIHRPYQATLVWKVVPPLGYEATLWPKPSTRKLGPASLEREVERTAEGHILITSTFTTGKGLYTAEEVNAFRSAYEEWADGYRPVVEVEHAAEALRNRENFAGAVHLLQRESKEHPQSGAAQMRLAFLLSGVIPSASEKAAQQAIRREPGSAARRIQLATLLSQNFLGQDLEKGFDRAGALEAYRKTFELDPERLYARLRQAVLLEYSEAGRRYEASRDDLLEAVRIYDSISDKDLREYDGGSFKNNAVFPLFWAREYEKTAERLNAIPREELPAEIAVATVGMLSGVQAAVDETERLGLSPEQRASALAEASSAFAGDRNYRSAYEALQAIGASAQTPTLKQRALSLRDIEKVDPNELPESTPSEMAVKALSLVLTSSEDDFPSIARQYLSERARSAGEEDRTFRALKARRRPNSLPRRVTPELLGDIFVSTTTATSEGSDELGYRVKIGSKQSRGSSSYAFVVREGTRYKLRALEGSRSTLGAEAYAALQVGKDDKARQWLQWALEGYRAAGGDDPLRTTPYAALWDDGSGDLEAAAAALTAMSDQAKTVIPFLEKRLRATQGKEQHKLYLQSLYYAYDRVEDHDKKLAIAKQLQAEVPRSEIALDFLLDALWDAEKFERFSTTVDEHLAQAKKAHDRDQQGRLLQRSIRVRQRLGDIAGARAVRAEFIAEHEPSAGAYNDQAWAGLFLEPSEKDVELALKAINQGAGVSAQHTLGCLYADLGQIDKAIATLQNVVNERSSKTPEYADWYIVGRIAEHLGFAADARQAYEKIYEPSEYVHPTSTYVLAQKRLSKL